MTKIHEFFLTLFFFGKFPKAPGTFGSLVSLGIWFLLSKVFFECGVEIFWQNIFWVFLLSLAFFYGCFAIKIYTKKFSEIDHSSIVLDEFVGQVLPLQFTFALLSENYFSNPKIIATHLIFCFVFFRIFDISKPSFIGYFDRKLKSGFGVMFDDLLCGILVAALGTIVILLTF